MYNYVCIARFVPYYFYSCTACIGHINRPIAHYNKYLGI